MLAFGMGSIFGVSFRPSPVWLIAQAVVSYALSLAMVFVLALIIEALAPSFGGTRDRMQAFKVAAYAPTASWVAGAFGLLPSISILAVIGGLYSLYILYLGLQKLMKAPPDKATPYFAVVLVVAIVVGILTSIATSGMSRMSGPLHVASSSPGNAVGYAPGARA
jgi:hypothetical protein